MRPAPPPCCASARKATATSAAAAGPAPIAAIAIVPVVRATTRKQEHIDGLRAPSSLFPSPQVLPFLGRQRAEDRLQGHAPALALHFRARQDRAFAHHGGFGQ